MKLFNVLILGMATCLTFLSCSTPTEPAGIKCSGLRFPLKVFPSDTIPINGVFQDFNPKHYTVKVGEIEAVVARVDSNALYFVCPDKVTSAGISLQSTSGFCSSHQSAQVVESHMPRITGVSTSTALVGDTISIIGLNLPLNQPTLSVLVDTMKVKPIHITSTAVQFVVPEIDGGQRVLRIAIIGDTLYGFALCTFKPALPTGEKYEYMLSAERVGQHAEAGDTIDIEAVVLDAIGATFSISIGNVVQNIISSTELSSQKVGIKIFAVNSGLLGLTVSKNGRVRKIANNKGVTVTIDTLIVPAKIYRWKTDSVYIRFADFSREELARVFPRFGSTSISSAGLVAHSSTRSSTLRFVVPYETETSYFRISSSLVQAITAKTETVVETVPFSGPGNATVSFTGLILERELFETYSTEMTHSEKTYTDTVIVGNPLPAEKWSSHDLVSGPSIFRERISRAVYSQPQSSYQADNVLYFSVDTIRMLVEVSVIQISHRTSSVVINHPLSSSDESIDFRMKISSMPYTLIQGELVVDLSKSVRPQNVEIKNEYSGQWSNRVNGNSFENKSLRVTKTRMIGFAPDAKVVLWYVD